MFTPSRLFLISLLPVAVLAAAVFINDQAVLVGRSSTAATIMARPDLSHSPRLVTATPPPVLATHAFASAYLASNGQLTILTEEKGRLRWPIASISKLFTAATVLQGDDLDQTVTLSSSDLPEQSDHGFLAAGEEFHARDLLLPLLMESSNNAATILSRLAAPTADSFTTQVNQFIATIGLVDTKIFNPSGLDPADGTGVNYSSATDLIVFAQWLINQQPDLLTLTRLPAVALTQANGDFHHEVRNTNVLLLSEDWSGQIIGGKTGQTDLAGKNLLLILREPRSGGYLINVVLGADDHFAAMRALVGWALSSYQFPV